MADSLTKPRHCGPTRIARRVSAGRAARDAAHTTYCCRRWGLGWLQFELATFRKTFSMSSFATQDQVQRWDLLPGLAVTGQGRHVISRKMYRTLQERPIIPTSCAKSQLRIGARSTITSGQIQGQRFVVEMLPLRGDVAGGRAVVDGVSQLEWIEEWTEEVASSMVRGASGVSWHASIAERERKPAWRL